MKSSQHPLTAATTFATLFLIGGVFLGTGCGDDEDENGGAPAATACVAGAKECLDPTLARVCPADGSEWLVQRCAADEKCDQGDCKADVAVTQCDKYSGTCLNPTTALRCRDNQQGYEQVACPPGTACQANGRCVGACTVGASSCAGALLSTCPNGRGLVQTQCAAGESCVVTTPPGATNALPTAACKPQECVQNGCSQCGNKLDVNADQTKFVSTCAATPEGNKWQLTACLAHETCTGGCGAVCSPGTCTPGTQVCATGRLGIQTCGADGKWEAAVTPCNANANDSALHCMTNPVDSTKAICAEPFCAAGHTGTCDAAGFRACGADGRLGAPVPCAKGICVASGATVGGYTVGACQTECAPGDERCSGGSFYQTCGANGRWAAPVACAAPGDGGAATCRGYVNVQGRSAKSCNGVCTPGQVQCVGAVVGTGTDSIQSCDATGQWTAAQACAVGVCRSNFAGPNAVGAACVADCIPNAVVCSGASVNLPGLNVNGRDSWSTCSATGLLPATPTACATGTYCRKSANGTAIVQGGVACVECVGPQVAGGNESGYADSKCTDAAGTASGSAATLTCSNANTWAGGAPVSCEALGRSCLQSGAAALCY